MWRNYRQVSFQSSAPPVATPPIVETPAPPPPPPSAPVNTVAPTITGTGVVGNTLTLTSNGTWTNNPSSFTRQWYSFTVAGGNVSIQGAIGVTYLITAPLAEAYFCNVGATNAGGTTFQSSNVIGAGTPPPPPPPPPPPTGVISSITLTSAAASGTYPYTFGMGFAQGHIPNSLTTDVANAQVNPQTYWPDLSLKDVIITVRAPFTQSVGKLVRFSAGPQPGGGAALTAVSIAAANPQCSIQFGSIGTVELRNQLATPFKTLISGPEMAAVLYRAPAGSSAHAVGWWEVRYYADGRSEILPYAENGYIFVASPSTIIETFTVIVNGVQVFSQALNIKARSRTALLGSNARPYWIGGDPLIYPKHDGAYLRASGLVPNSGWRSPSEAAIAALNRTFVPMGLGDVDTSGAAGGRGDLLCKHAHIYLNSGDSRAWDSLIANAFMMGTRSIHFRDENTNEPLSPTDHPNTNSSGAGTQVAATTTLVSDGAGGLHGDSVYFAGTHLPSVVYPARLLSGWNYLLDELLFITSAIYLSSNYSQRYQSEGISSPLWEQPRGSAWHIRSLAELLAMLPTTHRCYAGWKNSWEKNVLRWKDWFVDGVPYTDAYFYPNSHNMSNNLGRANEFDQFENGLGYNYDLSQGGTACWTPPWMEAMVTMAWGHAWNLNPTGTYRAEHQIVRDWLYKFPVGLAGDGNAGGHSYRFFDPYTLPFGTGRWTPYANYGEVFAEVKAWRPAVASASYADGLTIKYHDSDRAFSDQWTRDVSTFTWSQDTLGQIMTALAFAYEHGATGAVAAWDRITGSASWASANLTPTGSQYSFHDFPEYGILPRNWTGSSTATLPTWRVGQAVGEWREIQGSSLSLAPAGDNTVFPGQNSITGKQNAWTGWQIDTRTSKLYSMANGGHGDYFGNEVDEIALENNSPAWTQLIPYSAFADVTFDQPYYADGKPASRHSYYFHKYIEQTIGGTITGGRACSFYTGATSKNGNSKPNCDAFNPATGLWEAAGTIPMFPNLAQGTGWPISKHPTTEDVYSWFFNYGFYKWTRITNTWSLVTTSVPDLSLDSRPSAIDPTRGTGGAGQMSVLAVGPIWYTYDIGSGTFTQRSLSGAAIGGNDTGLVYVAALDCYMFIKGTEGGRVYQIHPSSFVVSEWPTTNFAAVSDAATVSGGKSINDRFLVVPRLGGIVYGPQWSSNLYFLKTNNVAGE